MVCNLLVNQEIDNGNQVLENAVFCRKLNQVHQVPFSIPNDLQKKRLEPHILLLPRWKCLR